MESRIFTQESFLKEQIKQKNKLRIVTLFMFGVNTLQCIVLLFCAHAFLEGWAFWRLCIPFVMEYVLWNGVFYLLWQYHPRAKKAFVAMLVLSGFLLIYIGSQIFKGIDSSLSILVPALFMLICGLRWAILVVECISLYRRGLCLIWEDYNKQVVCDDVQSHMEEYLMDYVNGKSNEKLLLKIKKNRRLHSLFLIVYTVCSSLFLMGVSYLLQWCLQSFVDGMVFLQSCILETSFVVMVVWLMVALMLLRNVCRGIYLYYGAWFLQVVYYGIMLLLFMEAIMNESYSWGILLIGFVVEVVRCYGYGILTRLYSNDPFLNGKYE